MYNKEPAEIKYSEPRYQVECLGDIDANETFGTLELALKYLKETYGYPDPEDDRMLIWEVLPSGHKKVIWHFSGWHWDADEFGIPQGKYPGDELSAYDASMVGDYDDEKDSFRYPQSS